MVTYQNGKIYKIEDIGGNMCYIWSTTKDLLSKRMAEHRRAYKYWQSDESNTKFSVFKIFDEYGVDNCQIVLIELYPCETKDELTSREAYFIRSIDCVNTQIPGRTKKSIMINGTKKIK